MKKILGCILVLLLSACSNKNGGGSTGAAASSSPTSSSPTAQTNGIVQLSWVASTDLPTGYLIEQSTNGTTFTQVSTAASGTTTVMVSGLTRGQTYYFRMRASNSGGDSPYTPIVSATP